MQVLLPDKISLLTVDINKGVDFLKVGIESINVYTGAASIDIDLIINNRQLDPSRKKNIMVNKKSVALPCEDVVTNAVNAAKPIVDALGEEKDSIELVIVSSESGIDFGKSITSYVHKHLGITNNCRIFEIKQACFGCTAAVNLAAAYIASGIGRNSKVLIISSDSARPTIARTYSEPTQSTGAVALLMSSKPDILELDVGAFGNYCFEVMDTFRPKPDFEFGNPDASLLAYLDCLEGCINNYKRKVADVDIKTTFDYLIFHAPFGGMVKGAHRKLMKKYLGSAAEIEEDFKTRTLPSLKYCMKVGNLYAATVYLGLISLIENVNLNTPKRVGMYSYGSGCSSEFFSGVVTNMSKDKLSKMKVKERLDSRYALDFPTYEKLLELNKGWGFGIENKKVDISEISWLYDICLKDRGLLVLDEIKDYKRIYKWS